MTPTIPVPRDVAREFVRTRDKDGCGIGGTRWQASGRTLRAALLTAAPGLLAEPGARVEAPAMPAMTPELLAALREFAIEPGSAGARGAVLVAIDNTPGILPPRPTPDEIAAAREVLERAGMKVTP